MNPSVATPARAEASAWSNYQRLLRYVRPHWKMFLVSSLVMAIYSSTDALFAALMKPMLDKGFVAKDMGMIRLIPVMLIGLFVFRGITGFVSNYGMNWVGRKIIEVMRSEVFHKMVRLPSRYYDHISSGDLVARLIYHVEQVAQASTNAVTIMIRDSFGVIFLLGWMFIISGWLAMLFLIVGPVMAYVIRSVSRRLRRISGRIQDSMGDVTHLAEEAVTGQRVVKAFGGQETTAAQFDAVNRKNRSLQMKMTATSILSVQVVQLLGAATFAVVIYLASMHSTIEAITAGDFVSFITAMMLLMPPLKRLTSINSSLQRGIAAADSIFQLLDEPAEKDTGSHQVARATGKVEFSDVGFAYTDASPVLEGVNFAVEPGQTVAIVGRSGSGKSTLVNLLPRFYDPQNGQIRLDGVDIRDYSLANLRDQIAVVGQEVILFNDSVARNIAYGRLGTASEADIIRAAELARAMDFIADLPQGLATPVGERGALLSGGQRQRIAIARALLKDAPILILDEATSALDTESERAIQAALERLMQGRTTLVIAHRLSTVEKADCILVMEQGRIVESGRHAELLAQEGHYAALYRMQFSEPDLG